MSTTVPSFTDLQRKTLQQAFQRSRIRKRSIVYPERGVMQLRSGMLMFCDLEVTVGDIIERLEAIASRIVSGDFDVSRKPVPVPGKSLLDFMQYVDKRTGGRHSDPFLGFARFYDAANELRSVYDSLSEESTRHLDKLTPDMSMPAFLDQFGSPPLSLSDLTRPISRRRGAPINRERLEIATAVGQLLVRSGIKLVKSRRGDVERRYQ